MKELSSCRASPGEVGANNPPFSETTFLNLRSLLFTLEFPRLHQTGVSWRHPSSMEMGDALGNVPRSHRCGRHCGTGTSVGSSGRGFAGSCLPPVCQHPALTGLQEQASLSRNLLPLAFNASTTSTGNLPDWSPAWKHGYRWLHVWGIIQWMSHARLYIL